MSVSQYKIPPKLSKRELECLRLATNDKTILETSEILHLSPRTVKAYRASVMAKFKVSSFITAVYHAAKMGIVD